MHQRRAEFTLFSEKFPEALAAVKSTVLLTDQMSGFSMKKGAVTSRHFSWVDMDKLTKAQNLWQAIQAWRWELIHEQNRSDRDVIGISFQGTKLGDDIVLFKALAPFVEDGSFIEMESRGEIWRWVFRNGEVKDVPAVITFPEKG
jgi:hypothetical protein